ncbi:CDP-alcohol phosphatidyltransferase family protein [Kordiimonas marina]|uniref:CDP-alcohol phosphatidyltransferase family protein n=1 Tax=Kordiimonas marina TaxID=2872312 RepID=UPI001FF312D0|nr:CDP-alcohol phosphatidyltransferase family protein [Kordiimonas marina]MCJ9429622.1 CDP-alcohol phosphatidyltransferase family protein [Kordiimonas marina]
MQTKQGFAAIIYADQPERADGFISATARVAGLSLIERQVRQLTRLGAHIIILFAPNTAEAIRAGLSPANQGRSDILVADTPAALAGMCRSSRQPFFLLTRADSLVDDRILATVRDRRADTVIAYREIEDADQPPKRGKAPSPLALACLVPAVKITGRLPAGAETFEQTYGAISDKAAFVNIDCLQAYEPELRRTQPMLFERVTGPERILALSRLMVTRTQKGTLDWPARLLHAPMENFLTRLSARFGISPNSVSAVAAVTGFAAAWFFVQGYILYGLLLALTVGVLDGVDGKLARATMSESRLGRAEHLLTKFVEYSWFIALAAYLVPAHGNAVWGLALVVIGFSWAEAVQGEFYRRLTGAQLDDAGRFERLWRLIGGRRNTYMWAFLPFVLMGTPYTGYWALAFYALVTFFVAQIRFIVRLRAYATKASDDIARNYRQTAYF